VADIVWNGTADGSTFETGGNWVGGVAPSTASDTAVFNSTANAVVINSTPKTLGGIRTEGTFTGSVTCTAGGNLTLDNASGQTGELKVGAGTFVDSGVVIDTDGAVNFTGSTAVTLTGTLRMRGTNTLTPASRIVFHLDCIGSITMGGAPDVNGNITVSGTFTCAFSLTAAKDITVTGSGTFSHQGGTCTLDGGITQTITFLAGSQFQNLTIPSGTTMVPIGPIKVMFATTISAGSAVNNSLNNPTWQIGSTVSIAASTWTKGTATITLNATSGAVTVTLNSNSMEKIIVNNPSSTSLTFADNPTSDGLEMTVASSKMTISSRTWTLNGALNITSGTVTGNSTSKIVMNATTTATLSPASPANGPTLGNGFEVVTGRTVTHTGDVKFSAGKIILTGTGALATSTFRLKIASAPSSGFITIGTGDITGIVSVSTVSGGAGATTITQAAFIMSAALEWGHIANAAQIFAQSGDITVGKISWLAQGIGFTKLDGVGWRQAGFTLTVNGDAKADLGTANTFAWVDQAGGNLIVTGNFSSNLGDNVFIFNAEGGTQDFRGDVNWTNIDVQDTVGGAITRYKATSGTKLLTGGGKTLYKTEVDNSSSTNLQQVDSLTFGGLLSLLAGSKFNQTGQSIQIANGLSIAATAVLSNPGTFEATGNGNISNPTSTNRVGTIQANTGVTLTGTDHFYTTNVIYNGTGKLDFSANNKDLFVSGNLTNAGSAGGGIQGSITTGKVEIDGAGAQSLDTDPGGLSLGNLRINKSGGTCSQASNIKIEDFALVAGTFSQGSFQIDMQGNSWSNTGGTFTASTGEVKFTGTQALTFTGSTIYYQFTVSGIGAAKTMTFPVGSTQTVQNNLVLQGASGQVLTLVSATPGTRWGLDNQGSATVSFVNVTDSNNAGNVVNCFNSVGQAQNNINWAFLDDPIGRDSPVLTGPWTFPGWQSHGRGGW